MAEGLDSLTFPMPRESESASRLRAIIFDMIPLFSDYYSDDGDVLTEYITVIVCNGKSQRQARDYLEAFLGEKSGEFVACLWELLLKEFSQGKQENTGSEPKTAVDCGSHDTLIEQGSSSGRLNDYDHKATNATYWMNDKLISATAREDVETHVSPKVKSMKMLRQELINSPCKRAQPKEKDDWDSAGVNYSRSGGQSGPGVPNATGRMSSSLAYAGLNSMKKTNSGPLSKHGEPLKKSSGPQSGGVTRQNSGPIPILPTTCLITSGPITSGPLNSSGAPRKISGPLDYSGSMKTHMTSVVHNQAVTTLGPEDDFSCMKSFPKPVPWMVILIFVMGFLAGGFILGAVHNAILLIVVRPS